MIKRVDLGKGKIMKLGLALGGGAVRGLAHIGVLKVLKSITFQLILLQEQVWEEPLVD